MCSLLHPRLSPRKDLPNPVDQSNPNYNSETGSAPAASSLTLDHQYQATRLAGIMMRLICRGKNIASGASLSEVPFYKASPQVWC
jgi:hypothetical protein